MCFVTAITFVSESPENMIWVKKNYNFNWISLFPSVRLYLPPTLSLSLQNKLYHIALHAGSEPDLEIFR